MRQLILIEYAIWLINFQVYVFLIQYKINTIAYSENSYVKKVDHQVENDTGSQDPGAQPHNLNTNRYFFLK
jgi:hypothetical protein